MDKNNESPQKISRFNFWRRKLSKKPIAVVVMAWLLTIIVLASAVGGVVCRNSSLSEYH